MTKVLRVAAVTSVVGLAIGAIGAVSAFNPQPEPPARFGMVGLARTQTAVLNVVLISPPPDDGQVACRRVLSFVDGKGQAFVDAAGNEASKQVELQAGVADSIHLQARDVLGADQLRVPFRAVVIPPPDDGMRSDCTGLVATLEIVGPLGATQLLYAPPPDDNQPPPDDSLPPPDDNQPPPDDNVPPPDDNLPLPGGGIGG